MIRILIIEDDEQIRSMLRFQLESKGFEVEEAPDGQIGLERLQKSTFALVITDLIMPEVEGVEVIRKIKERYPGIKTIAISGGGVMDAKLYLHIASGMGADRTFEKPLDSKTLFEAVETLTG